MKLENSTTWSDPFLRKMLAWCCRELDIPVRAIHHARFRNSRSKWGGMARCWQQQIRVCVGDAKHFPARCDTHEPGESFADRLECLVAVTAHEAYHVAAHAVQDHQQTTRRRDSYGSSERLTCQAEMRVLRSFRLQREALVAEWSKAPAAVEKPVESPQQRRAQDAADRLSLWQRKAKLAATKIKKYRAKVRYYDRQFAIAAAPTETAQ